MAYQVSTNLPIEEKLNSRLRALIESGLMNYYHEKSSFLIQLSSALSEYKLNDLPELYYNCPLLTISTFASIMAVYFAILAVWCLVFFWELLHRRFVNMNRIDIEH